jgi:hypothetical protein
MASQVEQEFEEWAEYAVEYVLHGHTFVTEPTKDEASARRWCEALDGKLLRLKVSQTTWRFEDEAPATS